MIVKVCILEEFEQGTKANRLAYNTLLIRHRQARKQTDRIYMSSELIPLLIYSQVK